MFLGCRVELLKPVEIPQVQFLGWWRHARFCAELLKPWRFYRCSSWTGGVMPVVVSTAEARGDSTGAVLGLVATCPFLC